MTCPRCQHENPSDAGFCQECGTRLEAACSSCGTPNQLGAKFCKKCGQRLGQGEVAQVPGPRFAAPERYTPKHLAEKILTSKSALEGERKQVTVLFADLKGSMELLADRDPEDARKLLDPVLERMIEAVHRYEGTVNQVMGDGIMALFGAPLAHEDHAVRACYAALRMQERVGRYAEELRRSQGLDVQIRVGLNAGEVVVRAIGSDLHMDYTAVGQTTHLAGRMEQLARPGTILLTGNLLRLAEGYVEVTPLGPVPVKGLPTPVDVYELVRAGPARSRLQAGAARGLTRFVGREAELEQLRQALDKAGAGHGQIVALVGEPGVGKSRLVWEFSHSHRTRDWLLLESGSVSYGKATPYLPVIDLIKAYCGIEARDDARRIREKITGKLLTLDESLRPTVPAFLALLDVPVDDPPWQALDPPERRQRTLDAVRRLLLREAQVQPLGLILEDLHWIDSETQALLDSLVESLPTARILLLVNYRPEYRHEWGSKTYYTQLRLDPLPAESADGLLRALLGDDAGLTVLKRLLIDRTEGNPFFLEESVRSLVETGHLVGERGASRLVTAVPAIQVPPSVQAILAARIDRLPPREKRLLQSASVIGQDVPFALLQAIAEESEDGLRQGLRALQAAEFLYEASLFPDLGYTFKHALTHDVAYESLLLERRRSLHARIVDAIEQRDPGRLAEQVERLADHALRGEVWEKAVAYLGQAGTKAMTRSVNRAAAAAFEQALAASGHLPETGEGLERAIDLHVDTATALFPLRDDDAALGHLHEAERLATQLGDRHRLAWVTFQLSRLLWFLASTDLGDYARRARALAEEVRDPALQTATNFWVGFVASYTGDYRQGARVLRRVIEELDAAGRQHDRCGLPGFPAVMGRAWLARAQAELGEFDEGLAQGREAVRIAESLDHAYSLTIALRCLATLLCQRGHLADARRLTERNLAISQGQDLSALIPLARALLGHMDSLSGRISEAVVTLEQARTDFGDRRHWGAALEAHLYLAEAYQLAHRSTEAGAIAAEVLRVVRGRSLRGLEAYTRRLLAELAAHADPPETEAAEARYDEALALATELGMRPLVAHCHLGLGKLYRRTGDGAKDQKHLTLAATMYREMGMNFWLEKAEAELAPPTRKDG
jgi:class 3 adenylate cyclase/tetratricopeptide (TPR) repeat protein